METRKENRILLLGVIWAACGGSIVRAGALVEQTFLLRPGWNSLYLEVEPEQNDPPTVFAGLPVTSVWTRIPRTSSAQFIQDPHEGSFSRSGWLSWIPGEPPFLTNLFRVQANRAYLIKLAGGNDVVWTLTGRPALRDIEWAPNATNLTGLPVTLQSSMSFAAFFGPSPAHNGQPVYRVGPSGAFIPVNAATETIRSGVAYWIYSRGASNYTGPLGVHVSRTDGLDYGGVTLEQELRIENLSQRPKAFLRTSHSDHPVPLSYFSLSQQGHINWSELPSEHEIQLPAKGTKVFRLTVRRADFGSESVQTVLELTDGQGLRRWIPVSALRREPASAARRGTAGGIHPFAGLWAGTVTIGAVSEARTGSTDPRPTASEFSFRLIIHVDDAGQARLLKQVIQMWEDGTVNPDGTVSTPGRFVLLTDDARVVDFKGAGLRDGDPVGFRVSTAAYDFEGNESAMKGEFALTGVLATDLQISPEAATNPFKHRYHPDHDNLDARFVGFLEEAYTIHRHLELRFTETDPLKSDPMAPNPPDWGDTLVGGIYRETLSGLHRNTIVSQGTFHLRRVADSPVLNPMPGEQTP